MHFSILRITGLILYLINLFLNAESTFRRSWGRNKDTNSAPRALQVSTDSNGFALRGYLASLMDYSYVVSYHYKESGRLFCSGSLITPYWTMSVPNCFHIPIYYYRNRKTHKARKREIDEYPYGFLSLKDSLTVKPKEYSKKELRQLKKIVSLKPETVVVANALTNNFDIKIPNIGPISIEGDEPISCRVAGYGTLKLNRTIYSHPVLSVIDVEVFASDMCQMISKTYNVTIDADPSDYVCSYNRKYRYGSPLSQGDSGAPLICGDNIVGLSQWIFSPAPGYLSFGPSQPTPHIYTKLEVYFTWILNQTENNLDEKAIMIRRSKGVNMSIHSSELNSTILVLLMVIQYYLYDVNYNKF
ncbi:alpha-fibrinogenase-like isoform X2 [Halyomorpha halys]|uniref:alpha-fibrinogenase-like isoform X2 n=1 Tax=Halyomorpha halys TaxID=286706 RepID=UPI0006D4CE61|nr:snake venom serine protease homolog isoform X2 [Halyomorpha halys]